MPIDIKIPIVGESITEGTVARWFKKEGDAVHAEEPLFELETEKATTEVPAPGAGVLHITVPEGNTVAIGSVVGRIDEQSQAQQPKIETKRDGAPRSGEKGERPKLESHQKTESARRPEAPTSPQEPALSPEVRRLVREKGVDTSRLKGTGPRGRITREDVLGQLEQEQSSHNVAEEAPSRAAGDGKQPPPASGTPSADGTRERRVPMSAIRQRIAERLVAAQRTAAILTTFNEADLSAVIAIRKQYKEAFQQKHGVGLGVMSFFVKAAVGSLRAYPIINSRIDGSDIVYPECYNVGVAVSTERGLMVPVLRDADRMSFATVEKRLAELAEKARAGKISVDDLQGGTFTITNGGVFGSLMSTPLLNPPQSAILGMHAIQKRPVVRDDQIVIRPMMYLALSYDHRLIDGRDAVLFLVRVKECIENPERLMLEV
jgi:2-oxoglutarate dehydrogenase E2 component (dihydrolipoamide succinyltransferase)